MFTRVGIFELVLLTGLLMNGVDGYCLEKVVPEVRLRLIYRIQDAMNENSYREQTLDGVLTFSPTGVPICHELEDEGGRVVGTRCGLQCSPDYVVKFGTGEVKGLLHREQEYTTKKGIWYLWNQTSDGSKFGLAPDDRQKENNSTLILRATESQFKSLLKLDNFKSATCGVPEPVGLALLMATTFPNTQWLNLVIGTTLEHNKTHQVILERIILSRRTPKGGNPGNGALSQGNQRSTEADR